MSSALPRDDRSQVLLVEDDPVLTEIAAAKLDDAGFGVHLARTAEDALAVLRAGARIDAVFSDVVLPGDASGLQLARTIRTEFPTTAVLLTTGFTSAFDVAQIRGLETVAKPYDYGEVATRLAQMIDGLRSA